MFLVGNISYMDNQINVLAFVYNMNREIGSWIL